MSNAARWDQDLVEAVCRAQSKFIRTGLAGLALQPLLETLAQRVGTRPAVALWPEHGAGFQIVSSSDPGMVEVRRAPLPSLIENLFPDIAAAELSLLEAGPGYVAVRGLVDPKAVEPLTECAAMLMGNEASIHNAALLRNVFDTGADGIILTTFDRGVVFANQRFVELWKLPEEMAWAKTTMELRPLLLAQFADAREVEDRLASIYAAPAEDSADIAELKDGRIIEVISRPFRTGGRLTGRLWTFRDVTESQRALRAYQLAKERLDLGLVSELDTFFDWNILTGEVYSSGMPELRKVSELAEFVHPDDRQMTAAAIARHLESGEPYDVEYRTSAPTGPAVGRYKWIRARGTAIRDSQGRPVRMVGWSTNVNERREMLRTIETSEARYRRILEQAREVIFQADADLNLNFVSPAWPRCTGHAVQDAEGQCLLAFVHQEDQTLLLQYVAGVQGHKPEHREGVEVRWITASGTPRWLRCNMWAERGPDGAVAGFSGTILDVHERREAELARENALRAVEEAQQARAEFLATVSHEIRTPLNGIVSSCDLLAQTLLTANQAEYLRIGRTSSNHLLRLIDDLLDISKIEAGQLDVESVVFDPVVLLEEVCGSFRGVMTDRGLAFDLVIETPIPKLVGDPHRIRQVLGNLLANAAKFTVRGEVVVTATARVAEDARWNLLLSVTDTGVGIPAEKLALIFEKFVQLQTGTTRREPGAGLGLAISRLLAQRMGGQLKVASETGRGSVFTLELVLDPAQRREREPQPGLGPVLVCLDDPRLRVSMAAVATRLGRTFVELHRIRDADLQADEGGETLLVTDPTMLGEEEPGLIENLVAGRICLAVVIRPGSATQLLPAGALVVERPLLPASLLGSGRSHAPDGSARANDPPASAIITAIRPRVLLVEDNQNNAFLLKTQLDLAGYDVDLAASGADALAHTAAFRYDIVFMDVEMPGIDGLETTRRMRQAERQRDRSRTPIVALTAHALELYRERCLTAGMDDFLAKPVRPSEIEQKVLKWIDARPVVLAVTGSERDPVWLQTLSGDARCSLLKAGSQREALRLLAGRRVNYVLLPAGRTRKPQDALDAVFRITPAVCAVAVTQRVDDAGEDRWRRLGFTIEVPEHVPVTFEQLQKAAAPPGRSPAEQRPDLERGLPSRVAALLPGYLANRASEIPALLKALDLGDFEFLRRAGHNLKGSGGGYGLVQFSEIGRDLESAASARQPDTAALQIARLRSELMNLGVPIPPEGP